MRGVLTHGLIKRGEGEKKEDRSSPRKGPTPGGGGKKRIDYRLLKKKKKKG